MDFEYKEDEEREEQRAFQAQEEPDPRDQEIKQLVHAEIRRNNRRRTPWIRILVLALLAGLLGSWLGGRYLPQGLAPAAGPAITLQPVAQDPSIETAVFQVAKPSVVGITTLVEREIPNFFGSQSSFAQGVGSGVIVSEDGYILTNSHVVNDGQTNSITVLFSDGEEKPAELKYYDTTLDLAIIKVQAQGLKAAKLADSSQVQVGEKAIAIGNPLGLDFYLTQTSGIISGLDRSIQVESGLTMDGLFQTDAAINQGNSGGPLYNQAGEVIGINTAKASAEGIGFAIPINITKPIVNSIIEKGQYQPIQIGIAGLDVGLYQRYSRQKLAYDQGVVISEVAANSPAGRAGLAQGDIILALDGKKIRGMSELKQNIIQKNLGDQLTLTIARGGKEEEISLQLDQ